MARYIDADRLKETFHRTLGRSEILDAIIDNETTVDVRPVIHAKWEKGYTFPDGAYWKCTHCKTLIKVKLPMDYCNACGAKMFEHRKVRDKE